VNQALPRRPIVILISGRGSNMRALIEQSRAPGAAFTVSNVLSDQPDAAGLESARALGVPARALPAAKPGDRAAYDCALADAIENCSPALIVLAGFMRILTPQFVARFAGRILNIHPSLLPKFPGLHTHRRALEAHESLHGATVHFVTEQLDGGPPVIQARVAVTANDDAASLAARVQVQEHRIYPLAVRWFCEGRLRYGDGQAWLDGKLLREPVLFDGAQFDGAER
jgi:phosphoribosylglycinamide formyltransferase 1